MATKFPLRWNPMATKFPLRGNPMATKFPVRWNPMIDNIGEGQPFIILSDSEEDNILV